jgi:glycosyltransferase involved in cell wall biosynthesis
MGIEPGQVMVLFVGQAIPRKGIPVLIEAAGRAASRAPSVRVLFACLCPDEESREYLRRLIEEARSLHEGDRLRFLNAPGNIEELYVASDIVCVPSLSEPFGRVAVEAMLAERPVVFSNVGGLRETGVDGVTGIAVPPGDTEALALAIVRLAQDPDRRRRLGMQGRAHALRMFLTNRVVDDILGVYRMCSPPF